MNIFDIVKNIYQNPDVNYFDKLSEEDKKLYNPFMINRIISMNINFVQLVNEIQTYKLQPREQYLVYSSIIPKGKYFSKYLKKSIKDQYTDDDLELISKYFTIAKNKAKYYINIWLKNNEFENNINELYKFYGKERK